MSLQRDFTRLTPLSASAGMLLALTAIVAPVETRAQDVAEFYRGKTINLLIGVAVGGSYDRDARLVARYLGSHIPGNPTVVAQNMIGGGGVAMASYLQAVAPKDGTYIGMMPNTLPMNQMAGLVGARYDIGKFHWIGSMMPPAHSAMVAWHTSGVRTFDEVRRKEITAGATPKGSYVYTMAALLNEFLGAKFKIVAGYQGIASVYLALERGEVDSLAVTWGEFRVERANLIAEKKVIPLVQSAPKADDLPDLPTLDSLAPSDDDRGIVGFLLSGNKLGRPLAAPPGTPPERVDTLRRAFEATMKDPRFLKDVENAKAEFGPIPGETLRLATEEILRTPARLVERAKKILE
jgi:tripartite-type tricarboxylate transporter receptor subunit TctC